MDPAKTACDMVLTCWDRTAKFRKYIRSLRDNLAGLKGEMVELDGVYEDVKRLVESAKGEGWKPKNDPARWLTKVEDIKEEVDRILADGKVMMGKSCLCGLCFINCRARYKQSELAEAKRADLETELARGRSFRSKEDVAYEPADLILERSLMALEEKSGELCGVFETVNLQVKREEDRHMVRTPEVGHWLRKVEDLLEKEVVEILEQGKVEMEKARSHGGGAAGDDSQTQRNVQSCHGISKRVVEEIDILKEKLKEGRRFVVFTYKPDDPLVVEIPIDRPVGAESIFKEVWDWIEDETVKCIGLFGMGGVGKTHLLDRVHNQFLKVAQDYDFALRIVVSRPTNLDKIQEAILEKLKLQEDDRKHLERIERASRIHNFMKDKNFLLFLDDLWDPINLLKDVGIPCRDNPKKYKIIFTTREERVCHGMKADKTKRVECLPSDEALQLFRQNLGEETWSAHPWIPRIAVTLVRECNGLPLAIITVARAMTGTGEVKLWKDAEKDLSSRLSKCQYMKEEVLARLEFSYDRLPDETHKQCFLYLSIFPEDYEIRKNDVIDLWIVEGFLGEYDSICDARDKGERIFRRLRDACLVEFLGWSPKFAEKFKLHDIVREMALWVYSDHGQKENRVLVHEGTEPLKPEEYKKWKDAERVSIWGMEGRLHDSLAAASYSHISTLIIREACLDGLNELFLSMPCLRVLELLGSFDLPNNIWNLKSLRYLKIHLLPSRFFEVPVEIQNLNKLEVLIVSANIILPVETWKLSSLRAFHLQDSTFQMILLDKLRPMENWEDDEIKFLEMLEKMQSMEEISIGIASAGGLKKFMGCHMLHSLLRELQLYFYMLDSFQISTSLLRRLKVLHTISIVSCDIRSIDISDDCEGSKRNLATSSHWESLAPKPSRFSTSYGFYSLSNVLICHCQALVNMTSLIYHAPALEALQIDHCFSLEEMIMGDIEDDQATKNRLLLPCLKYLHLSHLPSLQRICRGALSFPSLKEIKVGGCNKLRELPLNRDSAKNSLRVIKGEEEWWKGLHWDDPTAKQVFSAKFVRSKFSRHLISSHLKAHRYKEADRYEQMHGMTKKLQQKRNVTALSEILRQRVRKEPEK